MEAVVNAICTFWCGAAILAIIIWHLLIIVAIVKAISEACTNLYHRRMDKRMDKRIREIERRRKNGNKSCKSHRGNPCG